MRRLACLLVMAVPIAAGPAAAQTFSSGSTGADGAFAPISSVRLTVPVDGVFNFTTITVPSGIVVSFDAPDGAPRPAITMLATGTVTIAGRIDVSGVDGGPGGSGTQLFDNGGAGGAGGFAGGTGSNALTGLAGASGLGPGGGGAGTVGGAAGHAGHLTSGGPGGPPGAAYGDERLRPLVGGSGGGGGAAPAYGVTGGGGGGGGGAILIATSGSLTLTGAIKATGGAGGAASFGAQPGASGSGGAIRLVATSIAGNGSVDVSGGQGASPGRVRVEAFTNTATLSGGATHGVSIGRPGPVALPAVGLRITSVAGVAAPARPLGDYTMPDVILPAGTTAPVTVTLEASQLPPGTPVTVTASPLSGPAVSVLSTPLAGTVDASVATASLPMPTDQPSVITATASFTLAGQP